ncbi:MAG TPA: histidine phosphatase family protein [Phycisphaerales bacterium]|nr:histidine phosphatase family protein [Phycisphaerales bacterium]
MNATLIVLRHGKAAPHDAYPTDHARPLVARGHAEAEFIGRHLADHGPRPKVILTSPVLRALTTAQVVARHLHMTPQTHDGLSTDVSWKRVLAMLTSQLPEQGTMLISGHNPTLSELLQELLIPGATGSGDLHTGEAAILRFDEVVAQRSATLIDRVRLAAEEH